MSFPAYPSYKDSGVKWLGMVPVHWETKRLGAYFSERREKVSDKDYPALSVTKNGVVPQLDTAAKTDDGDNRKKVVTGDFVINGRSDRKGSSGLSDRDGSVSLINIVLSPSPELNGNFIHYLLRSVPFQEEFYRYGKGIVADLWSTNYSEMKNIGLAVPSPPEQSAIAAFLDREAGKIDTLVAEQQWLIALLKEKRQAVISHAVTKGLNPAVPMKDSGIEWLGEVPEHWDVRPLKYLVTLKSGGTPRKERIDYWTGDFPWASAKDLKAEKISDTIDHITITALEEGAATLQPTGSILVLVRGMMLARAFPVVQTEAPMAINQDLKALLPVQGIESDFLTWTLRGTAQQSLDRCDEAGHGTKALRMDAWLSMPLPCPPSSEQFQIARVLSEITHALDELVNEAETAISLLQERRAALISAAVTGKIDVRNMAQIITFPVGRARARFLVGISITERFSSQQYFGRVKLQKIAYLIETHCDVSELDGNYLREAAGPLDREMIQEIEGQMQGSGHVCVEQPAGDGTAVSYKICGTKETYRDELNSFLGARIAKVEALLRDLEPLNTKGVEAIATLYAVWNDELIEGRTPDDASIVSAVLNDWHIEKKAKFKPDELHNWLGWMRRHGVVPSGKGPKTLIGRLFV